MSSRNDSLLVGLGKQLRPVSHGSVHGIRLITTAQYTAILTLQAFDRECNQNSFRRTPTPLQSLQ